MSKVLVVSHEASLTGAPRVAIELLRAMEGLFGERIVLVRWPGPLLPDLAAASDRASLEPWRRLRVALRRFRRTRAMAIRVEERAARRVLRREKPDVVWLNTVLSACYARPALELGCEVVLHSHEMDALASATLARYRLTDVYPKIQLVACSSAAKDTLCDITGVVDIAVVPSVVDAGRIRGLASAEPDDSTSGGLPRAVGGLVVSCGTADHRKGTDLWLQVARGVCDRMSSAPPTFVWVGSHDGGYDALKEQLRLTRSVRFVGPLRNPYPWLRMAEVVVVSSRQDAFPLVVFEAMALGTPVVAFDVGGISEQIGDAGILVPPGDVGAMAEAVSTLMTDASERERMGEAAQRRLAGTYSLSHFHDAVRSVVGSLAMSKTAHR